MLRALLASAFCSVLVLLLFHKVTGPSVSIPHLSLADLEMEMDSPNSPEWSSAYSEWHTRALLTPHPNPHNFTPALDNLILSMQYHGMVGDGLTMALFSGPVPGNSTAGPPGSIAVDAMGRVLLVSQNDTIGILSLAQEALTMPLDNSWFIYQKASCQPTDILVIPYIPSPSTADPTSYEGAKLAGTYRQPDLPPMCDPNQHHPNQHPFRKRIHEKRVFSIHAFSKWERRLSEPVDGVTELPHVLWELFGIFFEGVNGNFEERDQIVLNRVYEALGTSARMFG